MTDFRALCAELVDAYAWCIDEYMTAPAEKDALTQRARAALAQPEPEGPTRAYLRQVFDDQSGYINDEQVMWWSDFQAAARAVLARWGNHPGFPDSSGNLKAELTGSAADGEVAALATAEMVRQLRTKAATEKANRCHYSAKLLTRAADLLARWGRPTPQPFTIEEMP